MTLYTSKVIAQWLCLTERRVRQLRDEGVIVEARPGLYELQPTVARYIKYLGGAGKESLNTERMKLTAKSGKRRKWTTTCAGAICTVRRILRKAYRPCA